MTTQGLHFWRTGLSWLVLVIGFGVIASEVGAQSSRANTLPEKRYTNRSSFVLPIELDARYVSMTREVILYSKKPDTPWSKEQAVPPNTPSFRCRVLQDGEYHYSVVTVNKSGEATPADVSKEPPELVVVIDTTPPGVELKRTKLPGGDLALEVVIRDDCPDYKMIQVQYQGLDSAWHNLVPYATSPTHFRIPDPSVLERPLRYTVSDLAKNVSTREVRLPSPTYAANSGLQLTKASNQPPAQQPAPKTNPTPPVQQPVEPQPAPQQYPNPPMVQQPPQQFTQPTPMPKTQPVVPNVTQTQPTNPAPQYQQPTNPTPQYQQPTNPAPQYQQPRKLYPPQQTQQPTQQPFQQPQRPINSIPQQPTPSTMPGNNLQQTNLSNPPQTPRPLPQFQSNTMQPTTPTVPNSGQGIQPRQQFPNQPTNNNYPYTANSHVLRSSPITMQTGSPSLQIINTRKAQIQYRIDEIGPSGVSKVDIWVKSAQDSGWKLSATDIDKQTPADVYLPGDGLYGISLAVTNGNGFGGQAPTSATNPDYWVEVDTTPPTAHIQSVDTLVQNGMLHIRWSATDKNLTAEPITLFYAHNAQGPWYPITQRMKNTGQYSWQFPRNTGGQFFIRMEVIDKAGNLARAQPASPIMLDLTEPRASVVGVNAAQGQQ